MSVFSSSVRRISRVRLGMFLLGMSPALSGHADLVQTWEGGDGDSSAMIQFDFLVGNSYAIEVAFDEPITGQGALDLIAAESNSVGFDFSYDVISYSFGDFLVSIDIDQDGQYGDGSTPPYIDYWHYWTADSDTGWAESMIGFSSRVLTDGSSDGWVFGTTDAPAAIPSPATLALAIPAVLMTRRRRRAH